jgi:hypothetical protein
MGLWDLYTKFPIFRFYINTYIQGFVSYVEDKFGQVLSFFRVLIEFICPLAMLTDGLTWIGRVPYAIFNHCWIICAYIIQIIKSPFELFYGIFLWPVIYIFQLLRWLLENVIIGWPLTLVKYIISFVTGSGMAIFSGLSLVGKTIGSIFYTIKNVIFPAV